MKRQALLTTGAIGIIGGAIVYLFGGNVAVSIVCSIVLFLLLWVINRPKKAISVPVKRFEKTDTVSVIKKGREQLDTIGDGIAAIRDESVHSEALSVREQMEKILDTLEKEPGRMGRAADFFIYYLPVFESILSRFHNLEVNEL